MRATIVLAAALAWCGALTGVSAADVPQKPIRVAVYRGPASCEDCSETVKRDLEALDPRYHVDFVGAGERIDISDKTLAGYDIYVQPAGGQDIPGALKSIGSRRINAIRNYVRHGGHYLGLCMGAYLADASNMGLITDDLDSEVGRPGFPVTTIDDAAVDVQWLGRKESVFFQDGPYFHTQVDDTYFRQIAVYGNGDVAAARYSYGSGLVILSGPHPEADASWFEDAGIPLEKMPQGDVFKDLIHQFDP